MTATVLMEQPGLTLDDELELTEHGRSVALISMRIARSLGFERAAERRIGLAGALHDVGKRLLDPEILEKPGPLDAADWAQIRLHPELGERILRRAGLRRHRPLGAMAPRATRWSWLSRIVCGARTSRSRLRSSPSPTPSTRWSPPVATESSSTRSRRERSCSVAPERNSTPWWSPPPYDVCDTESGEEHT